MCSKQLFFTFLFLYTTIYINIMMEVIMEYLPISLARYSLANVFFYPSKLETVKAEKHLRSVSGKNKI